MKQITTFLSAKEPTLKQIAPAGFDVKRAMKIAYTAMQVNPKLLSCSPSSIFLALVNAFEVGIEPGGIQQHGALVPVFNSKTKKTECQFWIMYRGWADLNRRSGQIKHVYAEVVHENDEFVYELGLDRKLEHKPCLDKERGPAVFWYAVGRWTNGDVDFIVLTKAELEQIRQMSKAPDSPAWTNPYSYEQMGKAKAMKKLSRLLPVAAEAARAADLDDATEAGRRQAITPEAHTIIETEAIDIIDEINEDDAAELAEEVGGKTEEVKAAVAKAKEPVVPKKAKPTAEPEPEPKKEPQPPAKDDDTAGDGEAFPYLSTIFEEDHLFAYSRELMEAGVVNRLFDDFCHARGDKNPDMIMLSLRQAQKNPTGWKQDAEKVVASWKEQNKA